MRTLLTLALVLAVSGNCGFSCVETQNHDPHQTMGTTSCHGESAGENTPGSDHSDHSTSSCAQHHAMEASGMKSQEVVTKAFEGLIFALPVPAAPDTISFMSAALGGRTTAKLSLSIPTPILRI